MYKLLEGLRVVECASFIAGPSASLYLAQLGAEVIRIDPVGGGPDHDRWPLSLSGESYYWQGLNKGKRSVCLDLSASEGRELAVALITAPGENGGVLVTNYPVEGFLAHGKLRARRNDLITLRIMGWNDGRSAVDYTINAATGIPLMTGPASLGDEPVNHALPAWDLLSGAYGAFAVLAAERHRARTGSGQEIRVPLSDIAIATLGNLGQIAETLAHGDRSRSGNDLYGSFGRDFTTKDGVRLMLVAITPRQWNGLVKALDLGAEIAALESELACSFADGGRRFEHRDRLFDIVGSAIAGRRYDDVVPVFEQLGACWSRFATLAQSIEQEPAFNLASSLFSRVTHPGGNAYPTPGPPATFEALGRDPASPAPTLGADTDAVLAGVLGMSSREITALRKRGVVA